MHTRRFVPHGCTIVLMLAGFACDKPTEAKQDPTPTPAPVEAAHTVEARVDLQGVVDVVASGEVATAAELEAELAPTDDSPVRVDIDADGKVDQIRIVEVRKEKAATFELRAVPSSEPEVTVEAAPLVATLELTADANAGTVQADAKLDASFKAVARIEGKAIATQSFSGISVSAEGGLAVKADANVFIAWAFEAERPRYVAEVFIAKADKPEEKDPCWPPGHCKHDLWKATGDLPPGQQDDHGKADDEHGPDHDKDKDDKGKDDKAKDDKDKPDKSKSEKDDQGKDDKAPKKADDKGKSESKPKAENKGDTGQPGKPGKGDTGEKGGKNK